MKWKIKNGERAVIEERRFYIRLYLKHSGHPPHAYKGSYNRLNKRKCDEIQKLALKGIQDTATMRSALRAIDDDPHDIAAPVPAKVSLVLWVGA